ncbi:MAG: bactofilin family protein [Stellaceae bacterium]
MTDAEAELELPARPNSRHVADGTGHGHPATTPGRLPESRGMEPRFTDSSIMEETSVAIDTSRPPADIARHLVDSPPKTQPGEATEARRLLVGREISLQGDITHCDHLVVEGNVTANLTDCRQVDITETGVFKGSIEIEQIEVRGLFEGTMNVSGRLVVRSNGRVVGKVQYGQIEIERGGQISGEVQALMQPTLEIMMPARNSAKPVGAVPAEMV